MQNINFDLYLASQTKGSESAFCGIMVLKIIIMWERKKTKMMIHGAVWFTPTSRNRCQNSPAPIPWDKQEHRKTEEMAKDQKKRGDNQCGIILIVVMVFYLYIHMSKYVYIKYHKFTIYQLRAMWAKLAQLQTQSWSKDSHMLLRHTGKPKSFSFLLP